MVGIWVGLEVYQNGMGGAFGGLFARLGMAEAPPVDEPMTTPGERAGSRLRSAYEASMEHGEVGE